MAIASLSAVAHGQAPSVTPVAGKPLLLVGAYDPASLGYTEDEFFVAGDATSYRPAQPFKSDGEWHVAADKHAPYVTRLVVLRPADSTRFNGTVVVEWLNVSGGLDAPADWLMAHRELVRSGYAYVGVSVQKVGIDGGASMGTDMSLKKMNLGRYQSLNHPGDAFAFDIFSQAGRLVHDNHAGILGPLVPRHVLAAGESQSAHFMVTYINAVDPVARVYDGFFVHSRFSGAAPIDGRSIMGGVIADMPEVVKYRPDLRVPVMTVITETDLIGTVRSGYRDARQPDTDHLRIWEIAGTAHADTYMLQVGAIDTGMAPISELAAAYVPTTNLMGVKLDEPINFAPQHHYVVEAALAQLDSWVRTGNAPPHAPPLELSGSEPQALVLDANGLAKGGIRTPWVDVPTVRMSGISNSAAVMTKLFGSTTPFDAATLARLYPGGRAEYLKHFEASLDSSIHGGFILASDRSEILQLAEAMFPIAK